MIINLEDDWCIRPAPTPPSIPHLSNTGITPLRHSSLQNTRHWTNVGLMFVQRRRRWANIKATLVRGLTFAGEFHRAAPDNAGKGLAADPGASPAGAGGVRAPYTAVIEGIESPRGLRGDLGGGGGVSGNAHCPVYRPPPLLPRRPGRIPLGWPRESRGHPITIDSQTDQRWISGGPVSITPAHHWCKVGPTLSIRVHGSAMRGATCAITTNEQFECKNPINTSANIDTLCAKGSEKLISLLATQSSGNIGLCRRSE